MLFAYAEETIVHQDFYGEGEDAYESHAYVGTFDNMTRTFLSPKGNSETYKISFHVFQDKKTLFEKLDECELIKELPVVAYVGDKAYGGDYLFVDSYIHDNHPGEQVEWHVLDKSFEPKGSNIQHITSNIPSFFK